MPESGPLRFHALYKAIVPINPRESEPCSFEHQKIDEEASGFCKVCGKVRFSVLFTNYDSLDMKKLLELYYLVLMLRVSQLKD